MHARDISTLLLNAHSATYEALAAMESGELSEADRAQLERAKEILCEVGIRWDRTHNVDAEISAELDEQEAEWKRGWDSVPAEDRGTFPLTGPIPEAATD